MNDLLKLDGAGVKIGLLGSADLKEFEERPAIVIKMSDGRRVALVGLTQGECRACLGAFMRRACLTVGA